MLSAQTTGSSSTSTTQSADKGETILGFFFEASDADKAFVGDKAEVIGSAKFRKRNLEHHNHSDSFSENFYHNFVLFFKTPDGKWGTIPVNTAKDKETGEVYISGKSIEDFMEEMRNGGTASAGEKARGYVKEAASLILARILHSDPASEEYESLPDDADELIALIDEKFDEVRESDRERTEAAGKEYDERKRKTIPIRRKHHMKASQKAKTDAITLSKAKNGQDFDIE